MEDRNCKNSFFFFIKTSIIKAKRDDKMQEERIISELKKGNLVIMPTDTVYGIVADATKEETIKKVFEAKERSFNKPLLVLVSDKKMLEKVVSEISPKTEEIISKYWPGPLTILFPKKEKVLDILTASSPYIAVRMPNDERLLNIIRKVNRPLISTSANITSKETITEVSQIEDKMQEKISYILDGGVVKNEASTIIKIENDKIEILRSGFLADKLEKE